MIKNYLKIAFRNLIKHKGYSLINIASLTVGLTSCFLIYLYVNQELHFDSYHEKADRIYRIGVENIYPEKTVNYAETPLPLAEAFKKDYPQAERITNVWFADDFLLGYEDKKIFEKGLIYADNDFFSIFTFKAQAGNPDKFLTEPFSMVLTASIAEKYFGDDNPVGKVIRVNNKYDYTVTGVVEDVPANSHFTFNFVASANSLNEEIAGIPMNQWGAFIGSYTYVLFPAHFDVDAFYSETESFFSKYSPPRPGRIRRVFFQPLLSIHLHSHYEDEIEPNNSIANLIILSTIGLFILLIACINFINLATARAAKRAREVGVRKVLGAFRTQLIRQFLGESVIIALLAMTLSFAMVEILLPAFSSLIGRNVDLILGENWQGGLTLIVLSLFVGALSGLYPALILSGFQPATAINSLRGKRDLFLRKLLVITQFAISIALITAMFVVKGQLNYMRNANLGFKKEYTLILPLYGEKMDTRYQTLKNELSTVPDVLATTVAFRAPIGDNVFDTSAYPDGFEGERRFSIDMNFVDYDYFKFFGLKLLAGRNFDPAYSRDEKNAMILNEEAMYRLGFSNPVECLNRKLPIGINHIEGTIIGVVKNFHVRSMQEAIRPIVIMYWPAHFNVAALKIRPTNLPVTIEKIKSIWSEFNPEYPFDYSFLDQKIDKLYSAEKRTAHIITTFSIIAIIIACVGLFGLASFTAEQRMKEIGIRKVLGATVTRIVKLLSKDFITLVLLANLIAWPVAFFAMNRWLQNFAYRIEIGWWVFLLAGGLALLIAMLTVSTLAIKAATANPAESLRYE